MNKPATRHKPAAHNKDHRKTRDRPGEKWQVRERHLNRLETLRNGLVAAWMVLCVLGSIVIGNQNAVLLWGGGSGIVLVAVYYFYELWLDQHTGGPAAGD